MTSGSTSVPEPLLRMAREQLDRRLERPERSERTSGGDSSTRRADSVQADGSRSTCRTWKVRGPRAARRGQRQTVRRPRRPAARPRRRGRLRWLAPRGGERFERSAGGPGVRAPGADCRRRRARRAGRRAAAGAVRIPARPLRADARARRRRRAGPRHRRSRSLMIFGPARRRLRDARRPPRARSAPAT